MSECRPGQNDDNPAETWKATVLLTCVLEEVPAVATKHFNASLTVCTSSVCQAAQDRLSNLRLTD